MSIGTTFVDKKTFGDSAGPTWIGQTTVQPGGSGNNAIQINQEVAHNASVTATAEPGATTYDVTIYDSSITYTQVTAFGFACIIVNLNSNTLIPQVYVKLKAAEGSSHDIIFPLIPGQAVTWEPTPTLDANGNAMTVGSGNVLVGGVPLAANITSITVTPDKYSDVQIVGTIEVSS